MIIAIILFIVSIILDGVLTNFLPFLINDLSYLTPLFTVTTVFIVYPFFRKNTKLYFLMIFITGIVYDLFYTNLLFFNGVVFVLIGVITYYIYKNFEINFYKLIIYLLIIIASYESLSALFLFVYNVVPITLPKLWYKISHSIIINLIYGELLFLIIKKIPKKYKQISIN